MVYTLLEHFHRDKLGCRRCIAFAINIVRSLLNVSLEHLILRQGLLNFLLESQKVNNNHL